MRWAFRSWVGLLLVITSMVARAEEVPRHAPATAPEPLGASLVPSISSQPSRMVTIDGPAVAPPGSGDASEPQASAGSSAKRRAGVPSKAPSAIDRYLTSAVRLVPSNSPFPVTLRIGASSQDLGLSWKSPDELTLLAPDAARHHDTVMEPHALEAGLLIGSLVLGLSLAFAPLLGSLVALDWLRMGVAYAAPLTAGVLVQAQYRPERLNALGRLIDGANAEVLATIEAEGGPLSAADRGLIDLYARSTVHFLAPPGGQPRLWRNGQVVDPGPGNAFLPSLLADVPEASLMAQDMVRLHRLGLVLTGLGFGVELLGTVAAVASISLGAAVVVPLLVAGTVATIAGVTGLLLGASKAIESQELFPKALEAHAQGLATRIGGRLP